MLWVGEWSVCLLTSYKLRSEIHRHNMVSQSDSENCIGWVLQGVKV
jgi:hypothetical protein